MPRKMLAFYSSKDYTRVHFQEQFTETFLSALLAALSFDVPHKNSFQCWYMLESSHHTGLRQRVCFRLLSIPSTLLKYYCHLWRCPIQWSRQDAFTHRFPSTAADGAAKMELLSPLVSLTFFFPLPRLIC